jgi:hypothetical protein
MAQQNGNIQRSAIMRCTCVHSYQDEKYGKGMRVHSRRVKGRAPLGWRCSVCGTTKGE